MNEPLFHTSCPSCGAPVQVYSATAVTVVCSYCSSLLVLQDGSLKDTGRDSALLQDFSPLQIGTQGRFGGEGFTIIGRLQARYDAGVWNEWYLRFDGGSHGWLSEAGDIHTILKPAENPPPAPVFAVIQAFETTLYSGKPFIASDVREITLTNAAAQGELPFRLPEKLQNKVADWRCENAFLTLDYAASPPEAFIGRTVKLNELALQHTRDEAQIRQSAGSLKGSRHSENCPNCGSPVQWLAGLTPTVVCPACGSDLDTSENQAKLIAADAMRRAQQDALPLPVGTTGRISGKTYTVIGAIRQEELEISDARAALHGHPPQGIVPQGWWREYLLYSPVAGFLWLVETPEDGWSVSETQTDFPALDGTGTPRHAEKMYDYGGRVSFAAGAFYWHIRAGDITLYSDYAKGGGKLSAERTLHELAWSSSQPVPFAKIAEWFKLDTSAPQYSAQMSADPVSRQMVWLMIGIFLIINIPAWLQMNGDSFELSAIVSGIVIWLLWRSGGQGSEDGDDD